MILKNFIQGFLVQTRGQKFGVEKNHGDTETLKRVEGTGRKDKGYVPYKV